jgi:hypothetical protein
MPAQPSGDPPWSSRCEMGQSAAARLRPGGLHSDVADRQGSDESTDAVPWGEASRGGAPRAPGSTVRVPSPWHVQECQRPPGFGWKPCQGQPNRAGSCMPQRIARRRMGRVDSESGVSRETRSPPRSRMTRTDHVDVRLRMSYHAGEIMGQNGGRSRLVGVPGAAVACHLGANAWESTTVRRSSDPMRAQSLPMAHWASASERKLIPRMSSGATRTGTQTSVCHSRRREVSPSNTAAKSSADCRCISSTTSMSPRAVFPEDTNAPT